MEGASSWPAPAVHEASPGAGPDSGHPPAAGAATALVPRFRQLLYRPRRGLGWPLWVDAPSFNLAGYLRVTRWPLPATRHSCCRACARLDRRCLDPSRPL
jgi:hypothetical protein